MFNPALLVPPLIALHVITKRRKEEEEREDERRRKERKSKVDSYSEGVRDNERTIR